jgi:hypothetical protein
MARNKKINKFYSFLMFASVVGLVGTGTRYTLKLSLQERNNFDVVSEVIRSKNITALALKEDEKKDEAVLGAVAEDSNTDQTNCRPQIITNTMKSTSITNFMLKQDLNPSFANRVELENKYGIEDYKGTIEQNRQLIYFLAVDNLCTN